MTVEWPKRLETHLRKEKLAPLLAVRDDLTRALSEEPLVLGIHSEAAASDVGRHAERALLDRKKEGWRLLSAARRLRAYGAFLSPSPTPEFSAGCALAILEALQWEELQVAEALGKRLEEALLGHWSLHEAAAPSGSELESLAFHLLRLRLKSRTLGKRAHHLLVDVAEFAGAAGLRKEAIEDAFCSAFYAFWDLCGDKSGVVPRGARLSAAPVFACLQVGFATGRLSSRKAAQVGAIAPAPFSQFSDYVGEPTLGLLAPVLKRAHMVVRREGWHFDYATQ